MSVQPRRPNSGDPPDVTQVPEEFRSYVKVFASCGEIMDKGPDMAIPRYFY